MNEEIREEMIRNKIQQTRINIFGPVRRQFEVSKKDLKLKQPAYLKNKAQKFFLMLKAFKNKQKIDKNVVKPRKK